MSLYQEERPLSDLFRDLMNETKILIQQEMQLLKLEMAQKAKQAGKDVGFYCGRRSAGLCRIAGSLICGHSALALIIPGWASALLVGLAVMGIGYALIQLIDDFLRMLPLPYDCATPPPPLT